MTQLSPGSRIELSFTVESIRVLLPLEVSDPSQPLVELANSGDLVLVSFDVSNPNLEDVTVVPSEGTVFGPLAGMLQVSVTEAGTPVVVPAGGGMRFGVTVLATQHLPLSDAQNKHTTTVSVGFDYPV